MYKGFKDVKRILEEHLSSINGNTSEIQAMFDYLQEMDTKVDKLSQRLDNMQLSIGEPLEKLNVEPLTQGEKDIFLVLYTEDMPITYHEISIKARIPLSLVPDCISSLINKKVPLLRSMINDQLFFKLSPSFKEMQAKENIVNLSLTSFMET